ALARIAAGHFSTRDFTIDRLRAALQTYVLEFPVYRTYVTAAGAADGDRKMIEETIARARARWAGPDPEIFDFLRDALNIDLAANTGYSATRVRNFALKLQQFTGPLMAKALEDTTFYRHHRLLALNEVGGDPTAEALSLNEFSDLQAKRAETAPSGLTASATHDTKRGEDARARILALSEIPTEWESAVRNWQGKNVRLIAQLNGRRCPSAGHEYMLYQALIGAWPATIDESFVSRLGKYALKAAREGKQETSWTNPNEAYEAGLQAFVRRLLDPQTSREFLASFAEFAARTALLGALNGLSQLALKALLPGVPDFYQGTEFWDTSLVDPDNRRPVDFKQRASALASGETNWATLASQWQDGQIKFALTRDLLGVRRKFADLLRSGSYEPLDVTGRDAAHVIAFTRTLRREQVVVAIGRHFAPLTDGGRRWPAEFEAGLQIPSNTEFESVLGENIPSQTGANLVVAFTHIPVSVWRRV
ncbi:MAG TPA: malto-oligosyltrehalose synthase, partial [Pseudolabrys sp.]|nr:malto-oligosyltrehalose synthase [Pseudolabrys sp.]